MNGPVQKLPSYIPSLDGLRAFAVIAVILYHLNPVYLPSGLLGVTLFFVLSGYLITGLLFKEWRKSGTISLPQFWLRRVRRLLPAIIFLLVVVAALTALFAPDLLTKLRNDMLAALLFFTNWFYIFQDVSYFEAMGAPSPVTHFWSLAIEEQFYLIWPPILLLLLTLRLRKRTIQKVLVVATVVSALLMVVLYDPSADPSRVYYGTDTRAFSLLIGAWLAFQFPIERVMGQGSRGFTDRGRLISGIAAIAALIGIICIMVFVNGYDPFLYRGGILLTSLLCAVLIVGLVNLPSVISRIFAFAPLVWLGQISYGVYLWHYPLLLLMNPRNATTEPAWWMQLLQVAVIIAVASFSYYFIENPIRHGAIGRWFADWRARRFTLGGYIRDHVIPIGASVVLVACAVVGCFVVPPTTTMSNLEIYEQATADATAEGEGEGTAEAEAEPEALPEEVGTSFAASGLTQEEWDALTPEEKADQTTMLMIGDSVSAALPLYGFFYDAFPNGVADSQVSRPMTAARDVYQAHVDAGWDGDVVVFALGTNEYATRADVEAMIESVPDDKPVLIVNVRTPLALEAPNNELLWSAAADHDNVRLLNWYELSAGHDEYFDGDGTHLFPEGCYAYLDMLRAGIAQLYYDGILGAAPEAEPTDAESPETP